MSANNEVAKVDAHAKQVASTIAAVKEGGKGVNKLVGLAIGAYKRAAIMLHHTACATLFHASETGDSRPLTTFFNGLRQNDRDALRIWIGKQTKVVLSQEDGSELERHFLSFKKDKGFTIVPHTENIRKGYLDLEQMLNAASFQDIKQEDEAKPIGLAEILALLARVEKTTKKKADDNGVDLPADVSKLLANITATVAAVTIPATSTVQ